MSRTVELPDDVYEQLQAEASAAGTTPAEWIAARVPRPCPRSERNGPVPGARTLADEFAGRIGLLDSGSDLAHVEATQAESSNAPVTCTLELPASVYERLEESAAAWGTTPEAWISAHLPPSLSADPEANDNQHPRTLADLMEGLIGQYSSGGAESLAENHSALFGEYLEEKRREGRL